MVKGIEGRGDRREEEGEAWGPGGVEEEVQEGWEVVRWGKEVRVLEENVETLEISIFDD